MQPRAHCQRATQVNVVAVSRMSAKATSRAATTMACRGSPFDVRWLGTWLDHAMGEGESEDSQVDVDRALDAAVVALGGEHREGQIAMARAVAATLAGGGHTLVQAGTGTGKSLAYLVPAALHAHGSDRRVVVATATLALQHQLVERDLPRMVDALEPVLGRRPTYAVLKGRHNYLCLERLNRDVGAVDDGEDDAIDAVLSSAAAGSSRRDADTSSPGETWTRNWNCLS